MTAALIGRVLPGSVVAGLSEKTGLLYVEVFLLLGLLVGVMALWARAVRKKRKAPVVDEESISFEELKALEAAGIPYRLLDVRSPRSYQSADLQASGAVRIAPDRPVESAAELALPKHDWLVAYCA